MRLSRLTVSLLATASVASGLAAAAACSSDSRSNEPQSDAGFADTGIFDADPGGLLDSGCATSQAEATKIPTYIEFVLDGSGSMNPNKPGDPDKWSAASDALVEVFDDMRNRNDDTVAAGLIVFSDTLDPTIGGPYPTNVDIYPDFVSVAHGARLISRLAGKGQFATPTFAALTGAFNVIRTFDPSKFPPLKTGGQKLVVFISDGIPAGAGAGTKQESIDLVAQELARPAPQGPTKTFSVGVGRFPAMLDSGAYGYDPVFMADLAIAGGTRSTPNCDPMELVDPRKTCHHQIDPDQGNPVELKNAFLSALNQIRFQSVGCSFDLDITGALDTSRVNVIFTDNVGNERVVPKDDQDGWAFDDPASPSHVELKGPWCDEVSANLGAKVRVIVGCATVTR